MHVRLDLSYEVGEAGTKERLMVPKMNEDEDYDETEETSEPHKPCLA